MNYSLVIERTGPGRHFRYDATLFVVGRDGKRGRMVATAWTETRWGARWWARRTIRQDMRVTAYGKQVSTHEMSW